MITITGHSGNALAGSIFEPETANENQQTIILLHGGGQTRHSWKGTGLAISARGHRAITLDMRGHGDSDWSKDNEYALEDFSNDVKAVVQHVAIEYGTIPIVIGASLGGMASMVCAGESDVDLMSALVLVDITPRMKMSGVDKILGFMAANAKEGFATLEDAADVIAKYMPHRPKPKDLSGLKKNLRLGDDGRFRWHWDPGFLTSRRSMDDRVGIEARLVEAAQHLKMPVLLVRGRESELVGPQEVADFMSLVPHAKTTDVGGARHMVAGDKNDVFADAVLEFIDEL